jgi:16S rRNA pseudouridine516 synthase
MDGCLINPRAARYFMLHKPPGVVCSTEDGDHRTVLELIPEPLRQGLHVAGRLDIDTTGLVLLTDDGGWTHRVISPKRHCAKRYHVQFESPLTDEARQRLEQGVLLRGEERETLPALIAPCSLDQLRLTIREGRYHQIKRMFAAVGNRVVALHREAIGEIELDVGLLPGQFRTLRPEEIAAI